MKRERERTCDEARYARTGNNLLIHGNKAGMRVKGITKRMKKCHQARIKIR